VLPTPDVAMLWVPQTAGTPNIAANSARAYWPGGSYVDWVGTDFYSRFPNFAGLDRFYAEFRGKPFVFGEWAMWGGDNPGFVDQLFNWINRHPRVRMALYNQGMKADAPFRLSGFPRSKAVIRRHLRAPRFLGS
jgi:beta-mannanase